MTDKSIFFSEVGRLLWKVLRFILLLGLSYVLLYPILYMLSIAFRPIDQMMDPSVNWVPRSFTLENFQLAWQGLNYPKSLATTLSIGGVCSILTLLSCSVVGYGFARFKFKFQGLMFAMVVLTIIIPQVTISLPTYNMFSRFSVPVIGPIMTDIFGMDIGGVNLIDNPVVFYLPALTACGLRGGLFIFIFRQFFKGLPKELEEAALIDGCGYFKTFVRIMAPNASASFLTVFLFSFVWYWNDYFTTSMFLNRTSTISKALSMLKGSLNTLGVNTGNIYAITSKLQAGCLLTIIPLLVMYMFLQKFFIQGVERSGMVG